MADHSSCEADDAWRPTCDLTMLKYRAASLHAVRDFFRRLNYLEVETPLLSHDIVVDAHLEPFEVIQCDDDHGRLFLQTSPEAAMKRLLAAGSGSIFQITRSFRRGEIGCRHNPEYTMLEWYGVGTTYEQQMDVTEHLVRCVAGVIPNPALLLSPDPFRRTRYESAFSRITADCVLDLSVAQLQQLVAVQTGVDTATQPIPDRDDLLNLLLAECVEPHLGQQQPEFLHDYPLSQAALAQQNSQDPRTACRFELYLRGLEICNGYQELTDPDELRRRDERQNNSRRSHQSHVLPGAPLLTAAMRSGLPDCSGVALGFDRLLMSLTGSETIRDVLPFPFDRA
ncbi:MAG: EF-P lysine aminoacylase EpmA [Planctomycetaceae bacterium]